MKTCRVCFKFKKLHDFYKQSRNRDGRDTRCKDCTKVYQKSRHKKNPLTPESIKNRNLKARYGLDSEEYDRMVKSGCFICGSMENLCVDHDHDCCPGKKSCGDCVRGILCWNHNIAESRFENIEEIERLLEYRLLWT